MAASLVSKGFKESKTKTVTYHLEESPNGIFKKVDEKVIYRLYSFANIA